MGPLKQQICELLEAIDVPTTTTFICSQLHCDLGPLNKELSRLEYSQQVEVVGEFRGKGKAARLFSFRSTKELSLVEKEGIKYWIKHYVVDNCEYAYDGCAELLVEILRVACEDSLLLPKNLAWFDGPECDLYINSLIDNADGALRAWKRIFKNLMEQENVNE